MTDQTEETRKESADKKKVLQMRPGRLELKKTVDAGQVRQSFSHGRSKSVAVEVRRKRTFTTGAGGTLTEVKKHPTLEAEAEAPAAAAPEAPAEAPAEEARQGRRPAVLRALTEEEAAARARALEQARDGDADAQRVLKRVMEDGEARRAATRADDEERQRAEATRRREEEEKRKREEEEAARRAAEQAERIEAKIAAQTEPGEAEGPVAGAAAAVRREATPETGEEDAARKARPEVRRPRAPRGEPRRRAGKLTLAQALNEEERTRSLASVRRQREREMRRLSGRSQEAVKVIREVVVPETITVQELANRMAERGVDVVKTLMKLGIMATVTQTIDADTAELVVAEFGHNLRRVSEADVEIGLKSDDDAEETKQSRPPVVTVMGHVDHGKTSLLDALRETDVAGREAGGITQHIGAYQVTLPTHEKITFIDTPGHAAFTKMRARGANVTDIVVLVVAADDGIMPQTVEAIAHARAAKVPIIVAVNKIDKPEANPARVRQELLQHGLVVEEMGGDVLAVDVSAIKKTNLDKLEEVILLQSEILELRANRDRPAEGVVIEANLERGRGPVATVLVQRGTLKVGDIVVAGAEWGRVRALIDDTGKNIDSAGPSFPAEILGLNGAPMAGDEFSVVENESRAREVCEFRARRARTARAKAAAPRSTLEQLLGKAAGDGAQELAVVIKADTHGSAEAITQSLEQLGTDEVKVRVLHGGVGEISESDIALAQASGALVAGFNVRANAQAREAARRDGIDIRYYSIIYNLTDDVKAMLSGMLAPESREKIIGNAEILEVFAISKVGKIAGCRVTDGLVRRGAHVRLLRDNVVIHEGRLATLKRFKDDVREVRDGMECGMSFENYQDLRVGDVIECFEVEEVARTL
jgi:translation initiation factor IF-2